MCWKPRKNNRWSQSKEGIKHQSCLLKSFGYYGKSIKSVLKARHAIRQPSTLSAQYSHILLFHSTLWCGAHPDSAGSPLTGRVSPCTFLVPRPHRSSPQMLSLQNDDTLSLHLGLTHFAAGLLVAETHSTCLLLWNKSQTTASCLTSFLLQLIAGKVNMFLSKGQAWNEITPPLLYQTHCDLTNTDSNICCTEKSLLPRNPPNSSSSETYLKLLESFFSPFKKSSALGLVLVLL